MPKLASWRAAKRLLARYARSGQRPPASLVLAAGEASMPAPASGQAAENPLRRLRRALERVVAYLVGRREASGAFSGSAWGYGALVEQLPLVVYASSVADGKSLYVSPQIEAMLGCSAEEAAASERCWTARVHRDDRQRLTKALEQWRAGPMDAPFRAEYRVNGRQGRTVWVDEVTLLVRGDSGEPVAFQGYLLDVSDHRNLEAELQQAHKLEAVGRLAGGVAHDFNNLLTVMRGYANRLSVQLGQEEERANALAIVDAAERGTALVRQLLAFARRRPPTPDVFDLNATVADVVPMLRRLIGEDIELEVALAPGTLPIHADRAQIDQVVVNLVVNARESMPNGGRVTLTSSTVDVGESEGTCDEERRCAVLTVADTGVGMDGATRDHMFEPFFTTKELGGTGLGLATVHAIVTQAGGSIAVTSEVGEGTSLSIFLPLVDGEPKPLLRVEAAPAAAAAGAGETVLLVEDEPSLRELELLILEEAGYTVLAAGDGAEALALAVSDPGEIDVVVTDVVLPGISGPQLVERLVALGCGAPVIFLSGYDADALSTRGVAHLGRTVISKPFREDALLKELRAALAEGRLVSEEREGQIGAAATSRQFTDH